MSDEPSPPISSLRPARRLGCLGWSLVGVALLVALTFGLGLLGQKDEDPNRPAYAAGYRYEQEFGAEQRLLTNRTVCRALLNRALQDGAIRNSSADTVWFNSGCSLRDGKGEAVPRP